MTLADVARSLSLSPATLRRWVAEGIVPLSDGEWTPAALAQARLVARLRARGHSLAQVRTAAKQGRLAFGYLEDLFPDADVEYSLAAAARETGLEPELIRRIWSAAGFNAASVEHLTADDLALLTRLGAVLRVGAGGGFHRGAGRPPARGRPGPPAPPRRGPGRRAAAGRVPAARARLRAGAGADRRCGGEALPPVRPRADDPRRRAGPG